ncbi:hypothetical protein BN132_63 [Cronobacter turicensis 564]|nr:hypothetical protein BN132_63 [Cronobacter turicensis 564]
MTMTTPKKIHHQQKSNIGLANAGLFMRFKRANNNPSLSEVINKVLINSLKENKP